MILKIKKVVGVLVACACAWAIAGEMPFPQIENGKVKCAVTETMVNGNLGELVKNIRAVSREICCDGNTVMPYFAADGVVISGK